MAAGLFAVSALGLVGCNPQKNDANYVTVLNNAGAAASWCSGAENVPSRAGLSNFVNCGTDRLSWRCETTAESGASGLVGRSACDHPGGVVMIWFYSDEEGGRAEWARLGRSGHVRF